MAIHVLVVGNDIHIHKLVVDILEITLNDVEIERATNAEGFFVKHENNVNPFNLFIIDCNHDKSSNEDFLYEVHDRYSDCIDKMIILIDSIDEKPNNEALRNITYIIKPFSLDEFGDLVKKLVSDKNK